MIDERENMYTRMKWIDQMLPNSFQKLKTFDRWWKVDIKGL